MSQCDQYYPDVFTAYAPFQAELTTLRAKQANNTIQPHELERLKTLEAQETNIAVQREMYLALRKLLREDFNFDPAGNSTRDAEQFPSGFDAAAGACANDPVNDTLPETKYFASIHGILISRNESDPSQGRRKTETPGSNRHWFSENLGGQIGTVHFRITEGWRRQVTAAVQRFLSHRVLYQRVFDVLRKEGDDNKVDPNGKTIEFTISTKQLAEVTNRLIVAGVPADDSQIERHVKLALSQGLRGAVEGTRSTMSLALPDLDAGVAHDIVPANVDAAAIIYFSAMLEEMKFHAVMEKVVEHFTIGSLPISNIGAGDRIYEWIKDAPERLSEVERRSVYGRVLGLAQGAVNDVLPNREFLDLFRRFASAVSLSARDANTTNTRVISDQQVHKAARDIAVNLSLHGYGIAHFAATEMMGIFEQIRAVLFDPEILRAYGVLDEWQLVDRIAGLYLGGSVNGVRYRTMATTGGRTLQWLAQHAPYFAPGQPATGSLFADPRLVSDVEQWLAVTGTPDATVEQLTDPVDLPSQPTLPTLGFSSNGNGVRQAVRGALEQVGAGGLPAIPAV